MNKQYLEKNLDKFQIPNIPIKGVKVVGIKLLNRNNINNDNIYGQARVNDNITFRVDKFQKSFKGGIDFNQPIPMVEKRSDGKFERIDGFGRDAYFEKVNMEYWPHAIVKCSTDLAKRKLRQWCNRTIAIFVNTEQDLVNGMIEAVEKKEMKNSKRAFQNYLNETEPYLDEISKGRIINLTMEKLETNPKPKSRTWTYTDSNIRSEWVTKHWENEPVYGFIKNPKKLNVVGDCYQVAIQLGYEKRKIIKAVERWVKYNKPTEIILHVAKGVTEKTLTKKRKELKKNIEGLKSILNELYKKKLQWGRFLKIKGFVPQHIDEDIKKLIPYSKF
jgi:hypothetical protein|tara:strand:- start:122 stop:1114 length:993 start_codon:yes stop_codon:yes gene_type:complete